VLASPSFPRSDGQLLRGDALLLYTDGVIETRFRDLTVGIDRMLGEAERLVPEGSPGERARICAAALAGRSDDRAVVTDLAQLTTGPRLRRGRQPGVDAG